MRTNRIHTVMIAAGLAGAVFRREERDPLRVPDPEFGGGSACGITAARVGREAHLMSPEGDPGGGGDDKKFSQADVDKIVQDRVGKLNKQLADEKSAREAQAADLATLKTQLGEIQANAESEKEKALLAGKSEAEVAKINLEKAQKRIKEIEDAGTALKTKYEAELTAERNGRLEDSKRNWATQVLTSGAAQGASSYAIQALLNEAQFELDEKRNVTKVTFEGGIYEKPDDLSKAFYKARPVFAKPEAGGSGHPRTGGNGAQPNGLEGHGSAESLIGAGLATRSQSA